MKIYFYRVEEPYGYLSNFSPHPIELDGHRWPTVEHYYQAQKFVGTPHADLVDKIRQLPTPLQAAQTGRNPQYQRRPDWDQIKRAVMLKAVRCKFHSHPDLAQKLLATGDAELIENSPTDSYWGCGPDGRGCNHLGQILMQVRDELRQAGQPKVS
ncbi:MAG: NADAR family protein [Gloeomargarita sp. SKYG116]|nr:NADAR family protein [Gloeomargarita sp. SKYG116]MCS7225528.1 NADAR family protein [Gloeomargarita sp. SKYB31]MDW8400767.1 NADAR family protein [Gloeomargarita sp. SKYGB_i_bin116]